VRAIALPASMILSTAAGASSGGSATPLSSAVAFFVPPLIALGVLSRSRVPEAGPVGLGALSSGAAAPVVAVAVSARSTCPATGSESFGRGLGSGGSSALWAAFTSARGAAASSSGAPQPASASVAKAMSRMRLIGMGTGA
jgi:hypothetical protein